jgi:hypothetical protein
VADQRGRDPTEPRSQTWLGRIALAAVPTAPESDANDRQERKGPPKLLKRVTRAQKVIAGGSGLGVLIAGIVAAPVLPWPLTYLQQFLAAVGFSADAEPYAYLVMANILLWLLVMVGATWLWLVFSWRMGRFPVSVLVGILGIGAAACLFFTSSPERALSGWISVAVLSIMYLHYYRKGRFGYTRGTAAAIFSHLALLCFFLALPFVLIDVLR